MVFDAPLHDGLFEQRIEFVRTTLQTLKPAYARILEHEQCTSLEHLRNELARIEGLGGEGMMLRKPQSRYERGPFVEFAQSENVPRRGSEGRRTSTRHREAQGRLGALSVELPDGKRFSVGTGFSDYERENPPPVGAIITFRYQELSDGGIPRFPAFVRERTDIIVFETNLRPHLIE